MFVSIVIFFAVIFPLLMNNKKKGLIISMCLLFILFGLEYDVVVDWEYNLERWNIANNPSEVKNYGVNTDLLYQLILKIFKPITFYGWLMFSAVIELYVIYKFTVKFVPPRYYWITIFILMMRTYLGFMIINSNRQSIALILTMCSLLILLKINDSKPLKSQIKTLLLSLGLLIACFFIHSSAAFAILLIPIFFLLQILDKLKVKYIVLIFNIIYFSRYFVNSETLYGLILESWRTFGSESYIDYIKEMEEMDFQNSFIEQFFNWIIITTSAVYFKKMSKACQLFSICYVASLFFQTLFGTNIQRVMIYLSIYVIFMIPNLVTFVNNTVKSSKKLIPYTLYGLMIVFCIMSYCKYVYWIPSGNFYKWKNYTSIFQAPTWK